MDAALLSKVRKVIDTSNRRFREDLKFRKYHEFARPRQVENDVLVDPL